MKAKKLLVTGSSGLIGSEVCEYFADFGWEIHGVDNNQRAAFFGPQGDNRLNQHQLESILKSFHHHELDIRDRAGVMDLVRELVVERDCLLRSIGVAPFPLQAYVRAN